MNELKDYIVPSAYISIFKSDIITSSPVGGGGTGDPVDPDLGIGGITPDDFDIGQN